MVLISTKVKLFPTDTERAILDALMLISRKVHNYFLMMKKLYYKEYGVEPHYDELREELPWLLKNTEFGELYSLSLHRILMELDGEFESYKEAKRVNKKARLPQVKNEPYPLFYMQNGFEVGDDYIEISYGRGRRKKNKLRVKMKLWRPLQGKVKEVIIFKDKVSGEYFASLVQEVDIKKTLELIPVGIDLGVRHLAVASNMKEAIVVSNDVLRQNLKYFDKQLDNIQSKIDRVKNASQKGSKRLQKRLKRLRKAKVKVLKKRDHRKRQILHIYANKMLALGNFIAVGDWNPGETLMDSSRANRTIYNENPVGEFKRILEYKVQKKGGFLLVIDEKDTSRTCSNCGYRIKEASPDMRDFACPRCGYTTDRDVNSSGNMIRQGVKVVERIKEDARNGKLKLNDTLLSIFSIPSTKLRFMKKEEKERLLSDIRDYFLKLEFCPVAGPPVMSLVDIT